MRRLALVAFFALLVLVTACAQVDRTVTDRRMDTDRLGNQTRVVVWDSNLYPAHTLEGHPCWAQTVVGQHVPESCLTASVLTSETSPFNRAPWLTVASTALVVFLLISLVRSRITWLPFVARTTAGDPLPRHLSSPDAVTLTRAARREQVAAAARPRRSRLYFVVPLLVGAVVPALILPPLIVLVGWGTAFGWGLIVSVLLVIGVFAGLIASYTPLAPGPSRGEPYVARLAFLGGAGIGFFAAAAVGLLQRSPLLELNGIAGLR